MKSKLKSNNIKSKTIKTTSIVFFVLGAIYLGVWYFAKSIINTNKICNDDKCFIVEVADTDTERKLGLMNRESMATNRGMIFVFDEQKKYTFWMKNTLIPLDMIRIDSGFNIVDIQTAQPCTSSVCETYTPGWDANYVLEINAGLAKQYKINIGDKLIFQLK